jgi:DNA-binding NarL/FixJ family response regulator
VDILMKTRIVLADDHAIFRAGLRSLLNKYKDLQIIGEVQNGRDAVRQVGSLRPDIVVMDLTMSDLNGVEATRQIVRDCPQTRVLCLTMHDTLEHVVEVLLAGAHGYVLKDGDIHELIMAVRTIARGQYYLSPEISGLVIRDYMTKLAESSRSAVSELSEREREILQLLVEGCSSSKIAEKLFVSIKTVATHRQSIMMKLNVDSLAELTKYALREGVTTVT